MVRTLCTAIFTAVLGSTALAAGAGQPAQMPATPPAIQDMQTDMTAPAAPAAPMAAPQKAPAMSPMQLMDAMAGIKGSADGTQTEIGVAPRLKRMLMRRQQGMIGGTTPDNKGKLRPIKDTGQFPYTTIGVVASGCTGTVVMQRFVLTAAWCVYDLKGKSFYKNLDFLPAMNGKQTPFGQIKWKNAWVMKAFAEKGDFNFGYGLIELAEPIGDKTGWFGFGHEPKFNFKKIPVSGYPFAGVPALTMWESSCRIDNAEPNAVFYRCTGDGKSLSAMLGAPMWYKGKGDNDWKIVGVHVTSQNEQQNSFWAARINAAATETLVAWAKGADQTDPGDTKDDGEDIADDQGDDNADDGDLVDDGGLIGDEDVVDDGNDDDIADDGGDIADNGGGGDKTNCTCDDQSAPK